MTREEFEQYAEKNGLVVWSKEQSERAIKALEQEPQNIKSLGEELRSVRNGIKDETMLFGYNMALAICNKYLEVNK